jgi:hypothetical protein
MVFEKNKSQRSRFALAGAAAAVLSAGFAFAACGGDDVDTNPTDDGDAAADGTTTTTTDSGTKDSGTKDSGGDAGWCGAGTQSDGGSICAVNQWENSEAGACVACPSATFACAALARPGDGGIGVASPAFTKSAGHLLAQLAPGTAQIVSGTVTVPLSECNGAGPSAVDGGTVTLPIAVSGDILDAYIDGGSVPEDFEPCGILTYTLTDACCGAHTVQVTSYFNDGNDSTNSFCDAGQ